MNKKGSIVLGFTFTVMIATSIMFYFKESEIQSQMSTVKRESMIINLDMARYAVERAFEDPLVVSRTFHAAVNQTGTVGLLACLTNPNVECENVEKDLVLVSPIPGKNIINPVVLGNGRYFGFSFKSSSCTQAECASLTMRDFMCDTYDLPGAADTTASPEDCAFRLRTTWKPLCPGVGECKKPKIVWILKLERNNEKFLKMGSINPSRYYVEKIF